MPRQSFLPDAPHGAPSQGNGAVAVAGDNYGTINTGVIINIRGDDIEKQREVSRSQVRLAGTSD